MNSKTTLHKSFRRPRTRNVRQLAALSQMGQAVLSTLDLQTVLNQILGELAKLLPSYDVSILLRDRDELVFAAVGGPAAAALRGQRMPAHVGIAGHVMQSQQLLYIPDTFADGQMFLVPSELSGYRPGSVAAVPLKRDTSVLGVLEAVHARTNAFCEEDLSIIELAASWVAIAVNNAQQHEALARRLHESETMAEVNRTLSQTLELAKIFEHMMTAAQKIIPNAEMAIIHLLDETAEVLHPVGIAATDGKGLLGLQMHPGEGIAGLVFAHGKPINVGDVQKDERFLSRTMSPDLRSLLVVPVFKEIHPLGTISVNSSKLNAFSEDDERLLAQLGIQAAIAIENARLFHETMNRIQQLALLYEAGLALNSALDSHAQLHRFFQIAIEALQADHALYFRYHSASEELSFEFGIGEDEELLFSAHPSRISAKDETLLLGWVARHRASVTIGDLRADPRWNPAVNSGVRSGIVVPVSHESRLLGLFMVSSSKVNAFGPEHQHLLLLFAHQAAAALENARLHSELQEALQQEQSTRAQLVLAEKLAALGRMSASVAHELNNPLQSIRNCLYIISQGSHLPPAKQQFLELAQSEIVRLADILTRLQATYTPKTNKSAQVQQVGEILQGVETLLAVHLQKNRVRCSREHFPPDLATIRIPEQFKQVFINLCLNAVDAMQPDGGEIVLALSASKKKDQLGIVFRDNGHGIPSQDLAHIFEPFFTTKNSGMGLGLPICYDIVHDYGGKINVESTIGVGTTFTVWLPLGEQAPVTSARNRLAKTRNV